MATEYKFGPAVDIAAAWINVEPILAAKQRGETLTRAEIRGVAGGIDVKRLEARIHRFFNRRGIHLRALVGIGWQVCTAGEQAVERTEHRRRRAGRQRAKQLHAAMTAPDTQLTAEERRHKELHVRAASAALTADRRDNRERRSILGTAAPRPSLKPAQ